MPLTVTGAGDTEIAAVVDGRRGSYGAYWVTVNADQIAAAERGDRAAFASDFDAGVRTQADVLKAAIAAGVAACAEVNK
jgi:isopentenyl diphosphate isomerase/L-lactate dehydrogenase-like FMN-dependent dehydrogenase